MNFQTVYDIGTSGYDGWLLVFIGAAAIGLGVHFLNLSRRVGVQLRDFGILWILIALGWTGWAVGESWTRYKQLRAVLDGGGAKIVQGRADSFEPAGTGPKKQECFVVQGVRFCYAEHTWGGGFKNDSAHGGPMAPGLMVRIHYTPIKTGNRILRLEAALPGASPDGR